MNEVKLVANQLDRAYRDGFWGGGSIRELFRNFSASDAAMHPITDAHSAWEIVLHIFEWHNIFRSRIVEGEGDYRYQTDWPKPAAATDANWTTALDNLDYSNKSLIDAAREVKAQDLYEVVPGRNFTVYEMLHGVTQHDQYHAGQVLMLKKAISATL